MGWKICGAHSGTARTLMRFERVEMPGVVLIHAEKSEDARGFFARSFCAEEFSREELHCVFVQSGISYNLKKGTVRGMHFQTSPREEPKLIRCTRGAIHDVLVDLRPNSPTYLNTFEAELTERNYQLVYAPPGVAHGFQTLADDTEVFYELGEVFSPANSAGLRWNDPAIQVRFPLPISIISKKDLGFPDYQP